MHTTTTKTWTLLLATPYPWTTPHPVNEHVAELADGLLALHRAGDASAPLPVVVAPSAGSHARRATRSALAALARGEDPAGVLARGTEADGQLDLRAAAPGTRRPREAAHDWPLLALPVPLGPASVSLRAALRIIMQRVGVGLVHVHDPLGAELTRFLVRQWPGLTIATFHEPPSPSVLGTIAAPLFERVVDGVDRWLIPEGAAPGLLEASLGIDVIPDPVPTHAAAARPITGGSGPVVVVGRAPGDAGYVRRLVRDLAPLLDARPELALTLLSRWTSDHRPSTPRGLRGRLHCVEAPTREQADAVLAGAGVYLALPGIDARSVGEARAAGVPVVELPRPDEPGFDDVDALHVLVADALAMQRTNAALPTAQDLALAHVSRYAALRERVQVHIPAPVDATARTSCVIDLHMHTSHSWDCATDPEALLHAARAVGLTAVAVTDHNEISGALACAQLADEYGIQVIVGEEVKTAQGEVIGLFLTERIEPGLDWHETLRRIRAQDGLVYVPHPFDRLHTIPDIQLLRDSLDEIDAFETYNARLPFEQYNRDAERFARKYNLIEGAGSDAHVIQGLGTAAVHMPPWDDQESFLVALGQGEILRRPRSLLYLQGLKWMHDLSGRSRRTPAGAVDS